MNKSTLFTQAHKIAKQTATKVGNYMIAFSLALKSIYKGLTVKTQIWTDQDYYFIAGTHEAFTTLEEATSRFEEIDKKNKYCEIQLKKKDTPKVETVLSNHKRLKTAYDLEMDALIAEASK